MYCKNCGAEMPDGAVLCVKCGYMKSDIANVTESGSSTKAKKGNKTLILNICISIVNILMCITCCILLAVSVNSYLSTNENYKFRSILDAVDANLQTDYSSQGMVTKYKNYNDVYVKYRYNGLNKDIDSVLVILILRNNGYNCDYVYTVCSEIEIDNAIKCMKEQLRM